MIPFSQPGLSQPGFSGSGAPPDDPLRRLAACYRQQHFERALQLWRQLPTAAACAPLVQAMAVHLLLRGGDEGEGVRALDALRERMAVGGDGVRAEVRGILFAIRNDVVQAATERDFARIGRLIALTTWLIPELAPVLASQPTVASKAGTRLLTFATPLPGTPRLRRRVVVAMSLRWFTENPASRQHEIGPLMVAAFEKYGWAVRFFGLNSFTDPALVAEDRRELAALCREHRAEALLFQEFQPDALDGGAFLQSLRHMCFGLKVVGVYLDPWDRTQWPRLQAAAPHLDGLWSHFPSQAVWSAPVFQGKTIFVPFPHQGLSDPMPPPSPASSGAGRAPFPSFVGGIDHGNWHRALWLAALKRANRPLRLVLTSRVNDHLPPLESYDRYLKQLGRNGCALSFSMRTDGSRIATGRVFEAIVAGALLVQEQSDDAEHFFTPDQHYLSFTSVGDLIAVLERMRREPERIAEIRRCGYDHFMAHYADLPIIAHLDWRLFGSGVGDGRSPV